MVKTKRIGESGRTPIRNLGYSDTEKNVKTGLQWDATAKEGSPRPNGQAKGTPTETQMTGEPGRVFVVNLNYSTTEEDIGTLFRKFGPVTHMSVPTDKQTGKGRGFAFANFTTPELAVAAIPPHTGEIPGATVVHDPCQSQDDTKKDPPKTRRQYRHGTEREHQDPEREPQARPGQEPKHHNRGRNHQTERRADQKGGGDSTGHEQYF